MAMNFDIKTLIVTGKNFVEIREEITGIYNHRIALQKQLSSAKLKYYLLTFVHFASYLFIIGFFYKKISISRNNQCIHVKNLEQELAETYVKLTFADKSQFEKSWLNCVDEFIKLMKSEKIWDITDKDVVDHTEDRTIADNALKRSQFTNKEGKIEFIKSDLPYLFLPNANGANLFIYPTFFLLFKDNKEIGIFDLKAINTIFEFTEYIEEENVPKDTVIIRYTWKKANKDGSQDKRFNGNYPIPVVKYGKLSFNSESGFAECYMFSNFSALSGFKNMYKHHLELLT